MNLRRFAIATALLCSITMLAQSKKILVYTRNYTSDGKGYVHANIATSVEAIKKIGAETGLQVDVSDDPTRFTDANLKQYTALIFSNSNNVAFDTDSQRDAFKHFIQHGGGFVGIHSASGSERDWDYFAQVLGGRFAEHPKLQPFKVHVADPKSPIVQGVPHDFEVTDECYFVQKLAPDIHILLTTDRTKLTGLEKMKNNPNDFPNPLPLAWYHTFNGGREFYIALGHRDEEYSDPVFIGILKRGILWAVKR